MSRALEFAVKLDIFFLEKFYKIQIVFVFLSTRYGKRMAGCTRPRKVMGEERKKGCTKKKNSGIRNEGFRCSFSEIF